MRRISAVNPYVKKKSDALRKVKIYVVLSVLTMTFCYVFCLRYGVFGAKVDWISQHSVLPDYFRF